ncbi:MULTISPECIES: chromate transporter [Turicibacter]|uniref:Chromate transporter n=3 Tax=Turicibacter TaxID=191303 RepID=A0A173T949_9FIRM|nr:MULTISPECIES: chromate transporter [Turicibacter]EFF65201.1 chromate transport protein [Turicibacter sanguinis PC909]EGC93276.1 chromate transport protein [Turicibacter sp. HGF1]MBP3903995.1 chromate transporter [Turicibacter sp.]MCU7190937.1 chromate transporter [Turicibacter sanguinis]MCU7197154.1 chromate transporter [Turicibacter sanguinis]
MNIIWILFLSFIQVGLFSVGGGYAALPLIQNQIVNIQGLMTLPEFADLVTIAEMTPGPISINAATFVGTKLNGLPGALICTLGVIIPSFIICLTLAHFYYKYRNFSGVQTILSSLRPAVVSLISSAGLSILTLALFQAEKHEIILSNFRIVEFALFVGGLVALRKFKLSPIPVIFGSGLIGTIIYMIF